MQIADQLELLGLEGTRRLAMATGATLAEQSRIALRGDKQDGLGVNLDG